ncbi:MAG: phosphotransferase [Treponema sp.]|nr:phosphotransferase [Treponema sp.]
MNKIQQDLKHKIEHIFKVKCTEVSKLINLEGSNHVYLFNIKGQNYVIKKLNDMSIMDWKREKAAYNSLKSFNITDELVYFDNGIKITKFLEKSKSLSYDESDMIDLLDHIRKVHESGISIEYEYDIIDNMNKYIAHCNKETKELNELANFRDQIKSIQAMLNKLKVPRVLCHGDACIPNFFRLPDGSIKILDWEYAGMADPLLDIAIATLHQGFENVDPVWCLHQYLKRVPTEQEFLRLNSFLALNSLALMVWCIYGDPENYEYYLNSAVHYSKFVLDI